MNSFLTFILICFLAFQIGLVESQPTFSDNCLVWNANASVCQQCNPGFYLQFFFCIPCNPNCACSSKHDFCQSCMVLQYNGLNYYSYHDKNLDQCILCNASMPYCLECINLQMCTKCFNGQYLIEVKDLDGVFTSRYCSSDVCQQNCQICENDIECKQCQPGFYLFPNKTCSSNPCANNCTTCQSVSQCSVCSDGYYLSGNECAQCIANCEECTNGTGCQTCQPQYVYQNGTCNNTNLTNCVEYASDFTVCTGCEQGFEVTAGSCNQCSGCNVCNEPFICLSPCLPGYYPFNFACLPIFQTNIWFHGPLMIILILLIY